MHHRGDPDLARVLKEGMDMAAHVKCRLKGRKTWAFLARGGTNRLRIHALRFETMEKAQALVDENAEDNPEWEFKAVPAQ